MADIFPREAAADPQPFTGERLTSALSGQTQIEHYHRYLFARVFCAGLDVLDVASGEGYGAAQLAQVAKSVVGVEYDAATVQSAAANFVRPNLTYRQGDARALPLADGCVDVVVSFETIEHFDRQEMFVAEAHRVLRPGGRFIVSTPDRDIYSPPGSAANPFHVRELTRAEFVALLRQRFQHVSVLMQRPLTGSAMLADGATSADPVVFDRRGLTHFEAGVGLPRAPYVVAVASDAPVPDLPVSLFIERSDLDTDAVQVAVLRARTDDLQNVLQNVEQELRRSREHAAAMMAQSDALERELAAVRGSLRHFLRDYLPKLRRHWFR